MTKNNNNFNQLKEAERDRGDVEAHASKAVAGFLGGGLFLCTQFIYRIENLPITECLLLFKTTIILFSVGLIFWLLSWLCSTKAFDKYIEDKKQERYEQRNIFSQAIKILDIITFATALIGSILLLIFIIMNNFLISL